MELESAAAPQDVSVAELFDKQSDTNAPPTEPTPDASAVSPESGDVQSEVSAPTLKDRVAELGFADVADDGDAQSRLLEGFRQERERNQQTQQQLEMLRFQMQILQQQGQQVPAQQAQAVPQNQDWWVPPQSASAQLRQQFIQGRAEDGAIQWKPNTPPQFIAEQEAEDAYYAEWAQKLVRSPNQALKPFEDKILAAVERKIQETIQQHQQTQQANTFVEQMLREHEDVLYQRDPVTKQIRRDFRGEPMLTEAGVRFDSILGELEKSGMSDETARWQYAQQLYKARHGDFRQQATQTMQQARAAHVAKTQPAMHIPARDGQTAGGRLNGGRPDMQSLGDKFFARETGLVFQ